MSINLGIELVVSVCISAFLGFYCDKFFDSSPFLFVIFLFFGILGGMRNILRKRK